MRCVIPFTLQEVESIFLFGSSVNNLRAPSGKRSGLRVWKIEGWKLGGRKRMSKGASTTKMEHSQKPRLLSHVMCSTYLSSIYITYVYKHNSTHAKHRYGVDGNDVDVS